MVSVLRTLVIMLRIGNHLLQKLQDVADVFLASISERSGHAPTTRERGLERVFGVLACPVQVWPAMRVSIATGHGFDGGGAAPGDQWRHWRFAPCRGGP